jgi:chromosome partitioning protein
MPLIIAVAHQKGGVGKSTLALNLVSFFNRNGATSAVVDADAQGSISSLINSFGENNAYGTVTLIPRKSFKSYADLTKFDQYQILVIDTPPYLSTNLNDVFQIADFVLVPTKPAVFDMFAIDGTVELINEAKKLRPDLRMGVVLNMSAPGAKHVEDIKAHLRNKGIKLLETEINKRVEFERCLLYSDSIFSGNDEKAKDEISRLGNEIIALIEQEVVVEK